MVDFPLPCLISGGKTWRFFLGMFCLIETIYKGKSQWGVLGCGIACPRCPVSRNILTCQNFGHVTIPKVRTYLFGQRKSLTMHAFCKSLQMIWYQTSPTFGHVFPAHFLIPPAAWWSPCCPIFSICNGCPEPLRRMRLTITLKLSGSLHALQPSQALRLGDWGTGVRGCGWRLEFQSFKPSLQQAENVAQNKHTSSLWSFSRKTPKLFQAKSMTESYTVLYIIFVRVEE